MYTGSRFYERIIPFGISYTYIVVENIGEILILEHVCAREPLIFTQMIITAITFLRLFEICTYFMLLRKVLFNYLTRIAFPVKYKISSHLL